MILNLTPHPVRVFGPVAGPLDEPEREFPTTGMVARVACREMGTVTRLREVTYFRVGYGEVEGLPSAAPETLYIVSLVVALAAPHRADLLAPYREVRNGEGTVVGCRQLQQVVGIRDDLLAELAAHKEALGEIRGDVSRAREILGAHDVAAGPALPGQGAGA